MQKIKIDGIENEPRRFFARAVGNGFKAKERRDILALDIYDEIGPFGVTAADVRDALRDFRGDRISISLNSPGGDVFDGIAIYNDLRAHGAQVDVRVQGVAASAASLIAMAGDEVEIAENAFLMIHNAWGMVVGNRNDLRSMAGVLEQIDGALAATYAERTGMDVDAVAAMMDAETWLPAGEAVELGFADRATRRDIEAHAVFDLIHTYDNTPEELKQDIEEGLRDAGFSRREAKAAIAEGFALLTQRDAGDASQPTQRDAGEAPDGNALRDMIRSVIKQ